MKIQPQHFHFAVAGLTAGLAVIALFKAEILPAIFLLAGGSMALVHYKAIKTGLIDL